MPKQPLGVTFNVPAGQEATGVYDDPNGVEAFETDTPYLLDGERSLQPPLPIKLVAPPIYASNTGDAYTPLAISLRLPLEPGQGNVVNNGIQVVHEGNKVVNYG